MSFSEGGGSPFSRLTEKRAAAWIEVTTVERRTKLLRRRKWSTTRQHMGNNALDLALLLSSDDF